MEFKIGDIVRIYSFGMWRVGEVVELDSELYVKFNDCAIVGTLNDTAELVWKVDRRYIFKPRFLSYEDWCFYNGALCSRGRYS